MTTETDKALAELTLFVNDLALRVATMGMTIATLTLLLVEHGIVPPDSKVLSVDEVKERYAKLANENPSTEILRTIADAHEAIAEAAKVAG